MLGFDKGKKRKPNMEGINLMAAILICFPEIGSVSYEPKDELLHLVYGTKKRLPEEELTKLKELLEESIRTYQSLENIEAYKTFQLYQEGEEGMVFVHMERDFRSVSRGEISMLSALIRQELGESIIIECHEQEAKELIASREEAIDHILSSLRVSRVREHLVAVREGGRVVVYNK